MKFSDYLEQRDPELYNELDLKKIGQKLALGGALAGAALGLGAGNASGQTSSQQFFVPPVSNQTSLEFQKVEAKILKSAKEAIDIFSKSEKKNDVVQVGNYNFNIYRFPEGKTGNIQVAKIKTLRDAKKQALATQTNAEGNIVLTITEK